ncbi:MAG: ComEC/Rec2 family competence protein [Candidatus Kerfeldbacteria bacterium]|nr:ComEC/Rec2 family competence protein [Candidatus Kerfeldbacteria bacterium]
MYTLHRSIIALASWLAFMAGVSHLPQLYLYLGSCAVAAVHRGWLRWLILPWLVSCGLVGLWRYDSYTTITTYQDGEHLTATVMVDRLPLLHDDQQRLVVVTNDGQRLQLDTATYPAYQYGDVLQLDCTIRLPGQIEEFAYDKYLARYHIQALCDYPTLQLVDTDHGNGWIRTMYWIRNTLKQQVENLWPEPVAALLLGVLIGEQDTIPESIYTAFQRAGVVHILVVSGMHVLILVKVLTRATKTVPRFGQLLIIITALTAFCVLTGFSATVIRATVMGSIPLLGKFIGRPHRIYLTLTWAAGLVTLVNPYILVHDVGFQLSFLATLGLVYVTPWIKPLTGWLPESFELRSTITTTLAATTTTAPWIAYIFGTWSNVALLANVIVIPISNLMLLAGAMITALSWLLPEIAQSLAQLLGAAVALMLWYVQWCAQLPHAYVQIF